MRIFLLIIWVLFCWNTAFAQEEPLPNDTAGDENSVVADSAEESSLTFEDYVAEDFGLKIPIPTFGELRVPDDLGWKMEPEVVFVWEGGKASPVAMIELRADHIGTEVTPDQYSHFYDKLVTEWENQPELFEVLRSRKEPYRFGEMDWLIIEVKDNSAASVDKPAPAEKDTEGDMAVSETVYYTIFTTFQGEEFYTIGFYYLSPVSEAVEKLAVPMLRGFSVSK